MKQNHISYFDKSSYRATFISNENRAWGILALFERTISKKLQRNVAIGNPERHMRKASHRGSKQQ